jgi:UrcA family protein
VLKSVLAGVGVMAIAGVTAVALHAGYYEDDARPRSLGVSAAGLDLTSPAGLALLEQRVERAVRHVCDDGDTQCYDDAWAGARPQIWAAIDRARERRASWGQRSWQPPRRYAPAPPPREWREDADDEQQAGYVSAPPPERFPARGRAPVEMSGVLGSPIDGAIDHAFQTGATTRWRDQGWRGVVRVGQARDMWPDICRMVTIVRATDGGWTPLREGEVCLGRDGRLHNGPRG